MKLGQGEKGSIHAVWVGMKWGSRTEQDKRGREEWLVEKMNWVRKAEICKATGGRRFNGEGGKKVGKENKCIENTELERSWGRIPKGGSRERRRKCPST